MEFDVTELRLLEETEEVEIETVVSASRERHRTPVWAVVVGPHVYVRSVNGLQGHWHQHLRNHPQGAIHAEDKRIPVRAESVSDQKLLHQVSEAYMSKYVQYPQDVAWIISPPIVATTVRLVRELESAESAQSAAGCPRTLQ